jgi:ABC-type branched-subunit amino acid transport system ATPase component
MHLRARDLVSGYGKSQVLHDVDFDVSDGELVAVLGPNGAGKSTLMKTLGRVLPVMSGTLSLDSEPMDAWRPRQAVAAGIGYVPQERNVFGELTVAENLTLAGGESVPELLDTVFDRFPILQQRSQQSAGSLSGGERQALAVSMAVLGRPKLLLLDEPTTGLSPLASASLTEWIVDVAQSGVSVVWIVEQNPESVLAAASRAYVLAGGVVRFTGPASEISGDRAIALALE